jgi:hypothetical protein
MYVDPSLPRSLPLSLVVGHLRPARTPLHSRIRFFFFLSFPFFRGNIASQNGVDVDLKSCAGKNSADPRGMQPDIDDMSAFLKRFPFLFALSGF